jgi:hypothetical protein
MRSSSWILRVTGKTPASRDTTCESTDVDPIVSIAYGERAG